MNPGGRHSKLICLLCLALPALAASGPGYLATVGPAPLRFWSPSRPKPAPVVTNTPPVTATPTEIVTPNPYDFLAAFNASQSATTRSNAENPGDNPAQPAEATNEMDSSTQPPQPGDVVSPQMLLKYFNKSTNGTGTGIIAPLDLSTPRATPAPSSSATYSN
jgi:hypothetical protein